MTWQSLSASELYIKDNDLVIQPNTLLANKMGKDVVNIWSGTIRTYVSTELLLYSISFCVVTETNEHGIKIHL